MGEEILLADRLYLAAGATEYSQPLPVGSANQLQLHAWVESAIALTTPYATVTVQTSPDGDNFQNVNAFILTISAAPSSQTVASTGTYDQLAGHFIRLKFEGGNEAILISAAVRLFHT